VAFYFRNTGSVKTECWSFYSGLCSYHFLILDSSELNSFSAPGGLIFVTRGLLQHATSEDMVACALSYSISHVIMHSGVETIGHSRLTKLYSSIAAAGNNAWKKLDEKTNNEIDATIIMLVMSELTRKQVLSADRMAITILIRAGYDAKAYLDLLRLVSKAAGQTPANARPAFLTWEERITTVEGELREIRTSGPITLSENRAAMLATLGF
jgi:predicted Zn-dependent protease